MDTTPLIAHCTKSCRNDSISLCREIFAENYKKHQKLDIWNSLIEYRSECDDIKLCALAVNQAHLKNKLSMKYIEEVEEHIVLRKSDFLINKEYIKGSDILKEKIRLKSWQAINDLPQEDVNKYSLLQKNDILPSSVLQALDFPQDSCDAPHKPGPCCVESKINLSKPAPQKPNRNSLECLQEIKNTSFKSSALTEFLNEEYEASFKVLPDPYVVFYNYKRKVIYKKIIYVQNISKDGINSILLLEPPLTAFFKIYCCDSADGDNRKLAPGLSMRYCVTFQTDFYLNIVDRIVFRVSNYNIRGKQYDTLTVELCSYRDAPLLRGLVIKASLTLEKFTLNSHFSKKRANALSETIDCGNCFQGDLSTAHLILRNYGSTGTFALITEMEWFYRSILNLTVHNELVLPSFVIWPAYFKLKYGEYIDISIKFQPTLFGLYCENLYMLSDNNTAERLDLIADGLMCNRKTIEITSIHFEYLKKSNLTSPDVKLDFGMCLFEQTVTKQIILTNKSCMQLKYRLVLEEPKEYEHHLLPNKWISINASGLLTEFGTSTVDVELKVKHSRCGVHAVRLIILLENVPDTAIEFDSEFLVIETMKNAIGTQMLDINMFMIEMICTVYEIHFDLLPADLTLRLLPDITQFGNMQCHVRLQTKGQHVLHCSWYIPSGTSNISMDPVEFQLMPVDQEMQDEFQECYFFIAKEALKAGKQICVLKINAQRDIYFELNIFMGIGSEDTPNCNIINLLQKNITDAQADLNNRATSGVDFRLNMFYVRPEESVYSEFSFASASPDLTIGLPDNSTIKEQFHMHSSNSCFDIVFVPELLYIGQVWSAQICLHNYSSIRTAYAWTFLSGKQCDMVGINVLPKNGTLPPLSRTRFDLYIEAKIVGIFEDIYLNCSIGKGAEVLQMRIMCAVEDASCKITLPDDGNTVVFWPLIDCKEYGNSTSTVYNDLLRVQPETNEAQSQIELEKSVEGDLASLQSEESGSQSEYWKVVPPPTLATIINDEASSNFTSEMIRLNDQLSIHTDDLTGKSIALESDASSKSIKGSTLREHFDANDLMVQEFVIEFKDVQTKKPVKKTIIIENLTPLPAVVTSEVVNFPALDIEESKLDKVLIELGYIKNLFWDKQLDAQGILIKPVQNKRMIEMDETLQIDIYVYADTFGFYADELLIDINDTQPFCVTILVEIVGCPIEFPIALNSIHPYPVLRFGNIHYKDHDITRSLRMYNSSSIPVSVLWHVLLKDKSQKKEEFNVLFDLHGRNTPIIEDSEEILTDGDVIITRRYYGVSNQSAFQIFPTESTINPKSYLDMKITFSSDTYRENLANLNIKAYLLGYIYMGQSYISQSFLYTRPYGKDLPPIKVLLTSTLELPQLKLNSISTEVRFKFYATEVCRGGGSSQTKDIFFKNNSSTTAKVKMTTDPPFNILAMRTRKFEMTNQEYIAVEPDEILQVTIQCDVTIKRVKDIGKVFFSNMEFETEKKSTCDMTTTIVKSLHIEQRATKLKLFPLNLLVLFPRIEVSVDQLDFGYCFLGGEKMKLVTIFNPLGCKVPFQIIPPEDIYVLPGSGLMPACTSSGKGYVDIKVSFVPRIPGLYTKDIQFNTNLSDFSKIVSIYAIGSWDTVYK